MNDGIMKTLFAITITLLIWRIGRVINYRFSYESMVKETIREQVKHDCLSLQAAGKGK